jgi:uncharacterized membrane-anchored protein
MHPTRAIVAAALILVPLAAAASAQEQDGPPPGWSPGPRVGSLGSEAEIAVPEGAYFLNASATRRFLEDNQNVPDGDELGAIVGTLGDDDYWFAIFSYAPVGYVKDTDRDDIDAEALMESMMEGSKQTNEERRKRGWHEVNLDGWHQKPFYDLTTNNLTWATKISSQNGQSINHSVRLLGRGGYMSVQLVASPESLAEATTAFNDALTGFSYTDGRRYAEFQKGDKLAGYGLAGLIGAGAAGVALKTGLFQKFWKIIVVGALALLGAARRLFAAVFGGKQEGGAPEQPSNA